MKLKNCVLCFLVLWASCPASRSQLGIVKANSFDSVKGKLDAQRRLQQIVLQDILATATEWTQFPLESSKARFFMTVQENSFVQRKLDGSVGSSGALIDTTKPTLQKTLKFTSRSTGDFTHTTKPNLQQTLKVTSTAGSFTHTTKPNIEQTLKVTSRSAGGFTHTTKPNLQQTLKGTSRPAKGISCYSGSGSSVPFQWNNPEYSFSNYSCIKYCAICSAYSPCTASQIDSYVLYPLYTYSTDELATYMASLPGYFKYFTACKTPNCNDPPLPCSGPPVSGHGMSCYVGFGSRTPPMQFTTPEYSFSNYSCVKYCSTFSQGNSSALSQVYTYVTDESATHMASQPGYFKNFTACKTRNCNGPPLSCSGPPGLPFGQSCDNMPTPVSCNKTHGCEWISNCNMKFDNCSRFGDDQSSCRATKNCVWQAGPSYSLCFSPLQVCNSLGSLAVCNANSLCTWYSGCSTLIPYNNSGSQLDLCGSLLVSLQLDGTPLVDLISPAFNNASNFCSLKILNQAVQQVVGPAWQSFSNNPNVTQALSCYYNVSLSLVPPNYWKGVCSSQGNIPCDKKCSSTSGSCNTLTGKCSKCISGSVVNSVGGCQPALACDRRCSPAPTSCDGVTGHCLNCTIPFIASKGLCFPQQKCNPRCASGFCDVLTGKCTQCSPGFNLVSGNCVPQLTCSSNCLSTACNGTTGRCSTCKFGSVLDGKGICLRTQTCDAHCRTCNSINGNCSECHSGYRPSGSPASCKLTQTCKNCINCDTLTGLCSQCSAGYSLNSGSCIINAQCDMQCKADFCNFRNGSCTQCNEGYLLNSVGRCQKTQKCDPHCNSSSACNPVTGACSFCRGLFRATPTGVCQKTYTCNTRCSPVGASCDVLTGICNNCSTGFVLSRSGACLPKQSCDSNCNSSFCNLQTGICKLCNTGFSTTPVGLCQKQQTCDHCSICDPLTGMCSQCSDNYVLNAGICIRKRDCSSACKNSTEISTFCNLGNGVCKQCVEGYNPNANGDCIPTATQSRRHLDTCSAGYVSNAAGGCQLKLNCSQHCSDSTGSCNYLNGSCSTCTGSYVANAEGGCQPRLNCSQHCSSDSGSCDPLSGQCSKCVSPYFKNLAGGCQLGQNCTGNCTDCDTLTGECIQCSSTSIRNAAGACQPKAFCSSTCQNCSYLTGKCSFCAADYIANDIGGCQFKLNCTNCALEKCNFLTGTCTECLSGYAPRNGFCQTQQNCSSQCLPSACNLGTGVCSNCTSGYVLNRAGACIPKQICSQNCSSCDFINGICTACAAGYIPNAAGICQEKVSCSEYCANSSCDTISGMCSECQTGYYTTPVGGCVPNANCGSQCLNESCNYISGACTLCKDGFAANLAGICATAQSCSTGCASCDSLTGQCIQCEDGYEPRAGNCFAEATVAPTIRPTSKSQVSPVIETTSKPQVSPTKAMTSKPQGDTPIVFSLQLSGVTVASLNNNTIKSKIISSIAAVFQVSGSQVNVTVVASGYTRSSRILNTESVTVRVTITGLTAQRATIIRGIIDSPTIEFQLQTAIRNSSPALSAVTVSILAPTLLSTKQPTSKTSSKPTSQPTTKISIAVAKTDTSNGFFELENKTIGGVVGGICGAFFVACLFIWWKFVHKDKKDPSSESQAPPVVANNT